MCWRLRAHEYVCRAGTTASEMLPLMLPGKHRFWSHVAFAQKHQVRGLNLTMYWTPTVAEPWYLITTESTSQLGCASCAKRFRIEEMFREPPFFLAAVALFNLSQISLGLALLGKGVRLRKREYGL